MTDRFFTVGTGSVYDEGLKRLGSEFRKLGRTDDYQGSIVFTTFETAYDYCTKNPAGHYKVYGLKCQPSDVYYNANGDTYLLNTSLIYALDWDKE